MPKKVAKKPIKYKFVPVVHAIASNEKAVSNMLVQREVTKDVLKGLGYEDIAEKRGLTTEDAKLMYKTAIDRWGRELGQTATEARNMDLKRRDALLERLHPLVFPEPVINGLTGAREQPPPDLIAMKLYLEILQQRAKILGTEAASKLENTVAEILRREYIGVPTNAQGVIDL